MLQILLLLYSIQFYDVVLTYDDGPINESYKLAEYLRGQNISATFFPILYGTTKKEKFIEFALINKHDVGNHTYTHKELPKLSRKLANNEVVRAHSVIMKYYTRVQYFRYPSGLIDARVVDTLKRLRYTHVVFWDVFSMDVFGASDERIVRLVRNNILVNIKNKKYSSIVLLHDCLPGSVRRTKRLVQFVKEYNLSKNILRQSGDNIFVRFSTLQKITKSGGTNDKFIVLDSFNK